MPLEPSEQRELRRTLSGIDYLEKLIAGEIAESPFNEFLGIHAVEARPGWVRLTATIRPEHMNKIGSAHGGFVSAMLDNACGMAVDSVAPPGRVWTSMDLHVRFLKAVTQASGTVSIIGEVDHAGRSTAVSHGRIETADGTVLAIATSSLHALDLND